MFVCMVRGKLYTFIYLMLYNKLSSARILIGSLLSSIKGQTHRWRQRSIQIWQLRDFWTNHNSLLSIATSQFALFWKDNRSCFWDCQSGEIWNKEAFFGINYLYSLLCKTNRFHVSMYLFSNRSHRTSKCCENITVTHSCPFCATFLFLPHFDIICDLLPNRRMATWNLFVNYTHCAR